MDAALTLRDRAREILASEDAEAEDTLERLMPLIYDELRAMAHRQLARERANATLQTTALVHEAYVKLIGDAQVARRGRAYFFAASARAMRQVLVDHARRRNAYKRGAGMQAVTLGVEAATVDSFAVEVLDLDRALLQLAERNARQARVVECRYFGGLSVEETADALNVSPRTVKADWALARAWLYATLRGDDDA